MDKTVKILSFMRLLLIKMKSMKIFFPLILCHHNQNQDPDKDLIVLINQNQDPDKDLIVLINQNQDPDQDLIVLINYFYFYHG